jgi:hypothetical protein
MNDIIKNNPIINKLTNQLLINCDKYITSHFDSNIIIDFILKNFIKYHLFDGMKYILDKNNNTINNLTIEKKNKHTDPYYNYYSLHFIQNNLKEQNV